MSSAPWEQMGDDVMLRVRVQPKASRNACRMTSEGQLNISLTAPPIDGEANSALIAFLAKSLQLPKSRLRLEQGLKSRTKTLRIVDAQLETVAARFTLPEKEGKQ